MSTIATAVGILKAAYPRQAFPDDTVRVYVRMLNDVPEDELAHAIDRLVKTRTFLPSIAEIRQHVASTSLALPSAGEAWEMANDPDSNSTGWPGPLIQAVRSCGGRYSIRTSENPTTMRAQFTKDYDARCAALIEQTAAGQGALPVGPTMAALPVSTRMLPAVGDPTEEQKHNAIVILSADPGTFSPAEERAAFILFDHEGR